MLKSRFYFSQKEGEVTTEIYFIFLFSTVIMPRVKRTFVAQPFLSNCKCFSKDASYLRISWKESDDFRILIFPMSMVVFSDSKLSVYVMTTLFAEYEKYSV